MKSVLSSLLPKASVKAAVSPAPKRVEAHRLVELGKKLGQRGPLKPVVEISLIFLALALVLLFVFIR